MEKEKLPPARYLPHELIVSEILVRLPVQSLLRFRRVCKAWRDTISGDTSFSEAHLRRRNRTPSSLLIAPYIKLVNYERYYPVVKYITPGLYLWEENHLRGHGVAALVDDMPWFPAADRRDTRHGFAHCDGLVMLPEYDGTVRVLNPATRRSLTLPWSPNSTREWPRSFVGYNEFGFGRDPGSGAYKVARFFRRDPPTKPIGSLGMEVFTIGQDRRWREITAKLYHFIEGRVATFFMGSLIWTVDIKKSHVYHDNDDEDMP